MAIAFDAAPVIQIGSGSSLTWSHTCSGSNRMLVVAVFSDTVPGRVTGVTYNSVSMTQVANISQSIQVDRTAYLYYLLNPATGSNTVAISATGLGSLEGSSASYTGVLQSGQPDNSTTKTSVSNITSDTLTLTTVADNCWTILFYETNAGASAGTGTTERVGSGAGEGILGDSNGPITPAGSTSMTGNNPSTTSHAGIMASFAPAPVAPGDNFMMGANF